MRNFSIIFFYLVSDQSKSWNPQLRIMTPTKLYRYVLTAESNQQAAIRSRVVSACYAPPISQSQLSDAPSSIRFGVSCKCALVSINMMLPIRTYDVIEVAELR